METTPIALLLAATEPERTQSLILFGGTARFSAAEDYPGVSLDIIRKLEALTLDAWGTDAAASLLTPLLADDPAYRRWFAKAQRAALGPRDAAAVLSVIGAMDVRQILASVRTPALVIHRKGSQLVPIEQARYLVEHLPDARLLLSDGDDASPWTEPQDEVLDEIEGFVTGARNRVAGTDRVLATVLFTDIVGSTQRAAAEGDRHWRTLLESHDTISRGVIDQHGGRIIRLTGDGVLATFDGPGPRSSAHARFSRLCVPSRSTFAQAFTPAKSRYAATTSPVSPCTSRHALWTTPNPAKSGYRAQSHSSWSDRTSSSNHAANGHSKACPATGHSSPFALRRTTRRRTARVHARSEGAHIARSGAVTRRLPDRWEACPVRALAGFVPLRQLDHVRVVAGKVLRDSLDHRGEQLAQNQVLQRIARSEKSASYRAPESIRSRLPTTSFAAISASSTSRTPTTHRSSPPPAPDDGVHR